MLFNSFPFLVFFIAVTIIYFSLPYRFRWILLLISSYYFYMCWKAEYVILIIISTLIAYYTALLMTDTKKLFRKKMYLCLSLVSNLAILLGFKYVDFITDNLQTFLDYFNLSAAIPRPDILLPIGISFYTFQILGYSIDVYRQKVQPERHLGIFAVYVAFFPQLVAGPIERANRLLPQFKKRNDIKYINVKQGLELSMWGLFKKVAIADSIAGLVDVVYATPQSHSGFTLVLATFLFSIQIYCDFSGYSDIAIGIAKILGYDLMVNFRQPYFSKSISEFWRRWHISLSTWFRDYLYIPLGGNRVSKPRWCINIMIVFAVSGLWHGANWTFFVWGLLHGTYLLVSVLTDPWRKQLSRYLKLQKVPRLQSFCSTATVFLLVTAGWVFFRANSLNDAFYILTHFFDFHDIGLINIWSIGIPRFQTMMAFVLTAVLFVVDYVLAKDLWIKNYVWNSIPLRYACYCMCFYGIIFFGIFGEIEFIYFQF